MLIEGIVGAIALALLLIFGGVWLKRTRGVSSGKGGGSDRKNTDLRDDGASAKRDSASSKENLALERSKLVVHALLQSISESVESLLGDSSQYGSSLDQHQASIKKAMTIAGIRELEKVLLKELEQMQSSNTKYRSKLDEANKKLTNQKVELTKLQSDAGLDFLTKIANRRAFNTRMTEELGRLKRYGSSFSLVILDVDHFKMVNDTYGHLAGDRILRAMAQIMEEQKRETDFLARYGGEEFVILLPETTADDARVLAEKIRRKIAGSKFRLEKRSIAISISAGVGELLDPNDSADAFFKRIDAALYKAKSNGRDRVEMAEVPQGEN